MDEYRIGLAGGWSYMPGAETPEQGRVHSALTLARDLHALRADPCVSAEWIEQDPASWDGDFPLTGELWDVLLWDTCGDEPELIGSLGQVNVLSRVDPYCEVVEAEIYGEAGLRGAREQAEREAWEARDVETS
jgi:hypothetical protein